MGRPATDYTNYSCQTVGKWHSTMHLMPLSHGLTTTIYIYIYTIYIYIYCMTCQTIIIRSSLFHSVKLPIITTKMLTNYRHTSVARSQKSPDAQRSRAHTAYTVLVFCMVKGQSVVSICRATVKSPYYLHGATFPI